MARVRGRREQRFPLSARGAPRGGGFGGLVEWPSPAFDLGERRKQQDDLQEIRKLQEAFASEARRAVGAPGPSLPAWSVALLDGDDGDAGAIGAGAGRRRLGRRGSRRAFGGASGEESDDSEGDLASVRAAGPGGRPLVRCEHVRSLKLAGVIAAPDGSRSEAVPGYGRGVPPSTDIEQSVVITVHPDRPPIVLTAAADGENLLWAPGSGWGGLSGVPFVSVFSRRKAAVVVQHAAAAAAGADLRATTTGLETTQQAKAQERRELEVIRREREAKLLQSSHLDPEREIFIAKEMKTTVLRPMNFDIASQSYRELEDKRILFGSPAPGEASQQTIPNTPRGLLEMVRRKHKSARHGHANTAWRSEVEAVQTLPSTGASTSGAAAPPTPSVAAALAGAMAASTSAAAPAAAASASVAASSWRPGEDLSRVLLPVPETSRSQVHISCLAAHPSLPRIVVGVGDGQVAVYHIYRAHGRPRPELHQTQGFDAGRKCGDVATAAYIPSKPLAQEGSLDTDSFVLGFDSGRVAVFKVLLPASLSGGRRSGAEDCAVLTAAEPLLLEHYHCKSSIRTVRWHSLLGIFSVSRDGTAMFVDMAGGISCCIPSAAGREVFVSDGDVSTEIEQLAVAGQRGIHLWQCYSQAKMGILEKPGKGPKRSAATAMVLTVRYLPTERFLLSAHEVQGEVRIWDVLRLELVQSICVVECPRAMCATWDPAGMMLLVYGAMGVAEVLITDETTELYAVGTRRIMRTASKAKATAAKRWDSVPERLGNLRSCKQSKQDEEWSRLGLDDMVMAMTLSNFASAGQLDPSAG